MEYLRAKILCDHLQDLSVSSGEVSQEVADAIAYASSLCLLDRVGEGDDGTLVSVGGLTCVDMGRFGAPRPQLSQKATEALAERLNNTLNEITSFYYSAEELNPEKLRSYALKIDEDVKSDLDREESNMKELVSLFDTILTLYQEASEVYPHLQTALENSMRKLPTLLNDRNTASNDLLALTMETSLLKLSLVRSRMHASLYGYTSSSNPSSSMVQAVGNLHERFTKHEHVLNAQEIDLQSRLQDYERLLELVDGQGGGFAQVVEDLATVRRETEDCRTDLRRLGWTEK